MIFEGIRAEREYGSVLRTVREQQKARTKMPLLVTGLCEGARAAFYAALAQDLRRETGRGIFLLLSEEKEARRLTEGLTSAGLRVLNCPARDLVFHNITASHDYEYERLSAMHAALYGDYDIALATPDAALQFTVPPDLLRKMGLSLCVGEDYVLSELTAWLEGAGYLRADLVDAPGQYSVHGGIADIYPPNCAAPLRLEFFGDTLDDMNWYDPLSQRRTEPADGVELLPAREIPVDAAGREKIAAAIRERMKKADGSLRESLAAELEAVTGGLELPFADKYILLLYPQKATLLDYFSDSPLWVFQEKNALAERIKSVMWHARQTVNDLLEEGSIAGKYACYNLFEEELAARVEGRVTLMCETFASALTGVKLSGLYSFVTKSTVSYADSLPLLREDLTYYLRNRFTVLLMCENEAMMRAVHAMLGEDSVPSVMGGADAPKPGIPYLCCGCTVPGFELSDSRFALLSLYAGQSAVGRKVLSARPRPKKKSAKEKIMSYADLNVGDYVVHAAHGIGQYLGLQRLSVDGAVRDFVKIKYAGTDMLYLPCDHLDMVSKYIGAHGSDGTLKLSRMGGTEWVKTRQRAKAAAKSMAKELIALYAERLRRRGFAFDRDSEMQQEFENAFLYEETDSQLSAVAEIKKDMESSVPMDRLLCGDVGFGKTEVALRAAFKAVLSGKQVAILVPTTILALQHYQTILARMRGFPVKADMLSRFRSPKQMAESVRRLRRGETDIIVGTHRLLSSDVEFRDLGLVIIDEEQRFGVAHKEKLKQLSRNVDVLTLTATPIPRTLNMAMSGIRDMSVLEEAPGDRFPVQSYVLEYDDAVIGEAIRRELRRGGQVFYLHNRVETIFDTAARIRAMAPEARVVIAHGQTDREELSDIWRAMVNNEADILVSTTIIETGVDIPNANTLIIERADCMGLSQLHQIRGRVGRSNRRAYAYFTYPRGCVLSEEAQKRLMAIREYTEFGSGFKVALRDLEIRGAGNLLGSEQHGHIDAVGYDMYMKLLNDAVLEEKGVPSEKKTTECTVDISVDAYIPEKYIAAASQRMDAYKKIASVQNRDDLRDVEEELCDRYGDLPVPVRDLLDISLLRSMGERCGIVRIEQKQNASPILRPAQTDPVIWTLLAGQFRGQLLLNLGAQPYVTCRLKKGEAAIPFLLNLLTQYADLADARDAENAKNSEKSDNIHTENTNV